ncbi:MAG: TonB-dependent receptor [Bacteroidales bacterium]|nr:TonB-dependent receptor [Bacteroidales bacterium]
MRNPLQYLLTGLFLLLPNLLLAQEPEVLTAAVVVADPPLVKTVGDTVVFSPDALYIEEDAVLEDVLRKIPGMEIENGTVTLYGRKVEKLLVGGRLYFGGDILTGLRNIQGDMIESIKAYVRPSDFARISGIDDGEEEPVLDVKIKRRFMGSWKGRVQGGGSYPLRYLASGNAGIISDSVHTSVLANFRNTPAVPRIRSTRPTRLGTGNEGERDRREAGFDYSKNGKKLEINANIKYTGENYLQERDGWTQNFYSNKQTYVLSEDKLSGVNDDLRAQAEIEWRPDKKWTFQFKPHLSLRGNDSRSAPTAFTYGTDQREEGETPALNKVVQDNTAKNRRLEGRMVFQGTRRMAKKGRTLSLRLSESLSSGTSDSDNNYEGLTYKNGKTTLRNYLIQAPWTNSDGLLQLSWNEPLGKGFHLQALLASRYLFQSIDRDYFHSESGDKDLEFSSDGSYSALQMNAQLSLRYVRKKFNLTTGVSLKPIWSLIRYNTSAEKDGLSRNFHFYAAPNITLRYNQSKSRYLSLQYRSSVSPPSPGNLIPVRSGTNPLYIREGNPDLKPSFTHRVNLSYNYSSPQKGSSLVAEAEARLRENLTASSTEYIPETGGRIIRYCNIGGNWQANGSVIFNHSFRKTPLSIVNHLEGSYAQSTAFLYNSTTKTDDLSRLRRAAVRERMDAILRWKRLSITFSGGGEYTSERSLLFPELRHSPFSVYGGVDGALKLPGRWSITADFGYYASRGHGFEQLDRDFYMLNASVSKSFLHGDLTLRLSGNDLLDQNTPLTYSFNVSNRRFYSYNGIGRNVMLQLIWRFSGKKY